MSAPDRPSKGPDPAASLVVYDRQTGEVLTVHHFSALTGVALPPDDHLHDVAVRHALLDTARDKATVGVLRVEPQRLTPGKVYRVSVKDAVLVELPTVS